MNGSAVPTTVKNRPRIPTPDREQQRQSPIGSSNSPIGVALMAHHSYQSEVPVLGALVLSPIQELDSGSVNNTLHANQPGTTALAQAVLSPGLGAVMTTPMNTPMTFTPVTVSQIVTPPRTASPRPAIPAPTDAIRSSTPSLPDMSTHGSEHSIDTKSIKSDTSHSNKQSSSGKWGEVYV